MPERLRLRFLAEDERQREIAELYWSQDNEGDFVYRVGEIAETYGLTEHEVREAVKAAAVAESPSTECDRCGSARTVSSRQDAARSWRWGAYVCDECQSAITAERTERAEEEIRQKRRQVAEHYEVPHDTTLDVLSLGLEEALALRALIRTCADEALRTIRPITTSSQPLAPAQSYVYELLKDLSREGALFVDPESDLDAFVWDESGEPNRYYLDSVSWCLPGPPAELQRVSAELDRVFENREWPSLWLEEGPHVQRVLAAHELSAYLVARYEEHHFQFSPGEKTWEVMTSIAEKYSIGQGYGLIWKAARDAAAFYVREECEKRRAAGYGIGALRRSFERTVTNGWSLTAYKRPWGLPESEVIHLFYRVFMDAEDPMVVPAPEMPA